MGSNPLARLELATEYDTNGGCWLFAGGITSFGYGRLYWLGETRAHRVSWRVFKGQVPDGMFVLHTCDTPCCWRIDHLFLGTKGDNNRDAQAKGRAAIGNLPPTANAKIGPDVAQAVRDAAGTQAEIARRFGIGRSQVGRIKRGEQWR